MASQSPIPGFIPLSPTIYVHQPLLSASHTSTTNPPPSLIILCTWTSAKFAHITKYTASYQTLYPTTPILLITTHITDLIIHSIPHKLQSLLPALTYLLSTPGPYFSPFHRPTPRFPPGSILLHTFSEGGSFAAVSLAQSYLSHSGQKLPVGAFIFDSTPGSPTPTLSSSTAAFSRTLPRLCRNKIVQHGIGGVVYYLTFRARNTGGHWLHFTQQGLSDDRLWDLGEDIPSTYLFSEKDDLVLWEDVQKHAVAAKRRSLMVRFRDTGHCSHVMGEKERGIYWGAVRMTWEGCRVDGGLGLRLRGLGGLGGKKGWTPPHLFILWTLLKVDIPPGRERRATCWSA
ncbi:hypothetical protein QBC40DRAFT_317253 [Triangularia verruculosa]|uniref:Uncharacterized protein n=1 Tax=Triangularia verruculosa TaxID=2587418 RepID=A0AAN6XMD0_9PEZI|nr:hypothetical protein QBC40DRAFT_317253 [Triangularia verruculosa]